jgi:hypothetical protein
LELFFPELPLFFPELPLFFPELPLFFPELELELDSGIGSGSSGHEQVQ